MNRSLIQGESFCYVIENQTNNNQFRAWSTELSVQYPQREPAVSQVAVLTSSAIPALISPHQGAIPSTTYFNCWRQIQ